MNLADRMEALGQTIGRFLQARPAEPVILTRSIFLRSLGVIFLIAFVSFWSQVNGLIGHNGILPAADFMTEVSRGVDARGVDLERYRLLPTLCWISASDASLQFQCVIGAALSVAIIAGFATRICLVGAWLLYLSLAGVGQEFMGYQWDNLLLEAALLAAFFAPSQILPRGLKQPPSRLAVWLIRLLLFKLMFLSGVVKLASGDPLWRNLTALARHYETQPLPNPIAWYAYQLPLWVNQLSCGVMFAIELVAPFLLFARRRERLVAACAIAGLQLMILLSGNFTFFNWLTIVLCIAATDDLFWRMILPKRITEPRAQTDAPLAQLNWWRCVPIAVAGLIFTSISMVQILAVFDSTPFWSKPILALYRWIAPFRSINSYGLFAVMTPDRPEIIVEGSNDGVNWKEFGFRDKPGELNRRPTFVAPHQPRLDWQMWFAALGDVRGNEWFVNFCIRLLQGSPETLALLRENPFPNAPPKFIRARLYDYRFTNWEERRQTGNWWKRQLKGEYLPAISLDMLQGARRDAR